MQVLIGDNHDLVLDGLDLLLRRLEPDILVLRARSLADALELAKEHQTLELVVLSLNLPGMDGVMGTDVFRSFFPDPPLVILSDDCQRQDAIDAMRYGASGFIPKTTAKDAMLFAFQLILGGEKFVPADLILDDDDSIDQTADSRVHLTRRERAVLSSLVKGHTNREIGEELGIQEVTVKLHLRNIYRKFSVKNRTQAVMKAIDLGMK